jgi:AraC family transcriptional regulator
MLLVEGQGHFLIEGAGAPCEFRPGHGFLSCGFKPFDCEDFFPANTRFRAVFLHFPLALRDIVGRAWPVAHSGIAVHGHAQHAAWLARIALDAPSQDFARGLVREGLPADALALLQVQYRALQVLHTAVSRLLLQEPAAPPAPCAAAAPAATPGPRISGRDRRRLLDARRHIDAHLDQPLQVPAIAAAVSLGESTLKLGFRHCFGRSVYDYVLQARCEGAAALLRSTGLPIHEIARRCGFSSTSHLARQFKVRFLKTPADYRRQ